MRKPNLPYWALTVCIVTALFLPEIFEHGMFFDGLTYSSIARNMSEGMGSFWRPKYTTEFQPIFMGHPPLAMGIQSLLFDIYGDAFYLEKVYSFVCLLGVAGIAGSTWHHFFSRKSAWIPVLFMLTIPITLWSYRNNLLENTMTLFTSASVLFFVIAEKKSNASGYLLGSIFVFLALLCKGPVGLFPLSTPFLYRLVFKQRMSYSLVKVSGLIFITFFICILLLLVLAPEAFQSLSNYLEVQVFPSLLNTGEITSSSRFEILFILCQQLLIPLLVIIIISALTRPFVENLKRKEAVFFLLLGLAASLPLMITLKQRGFYLIPSIPFYALAFATLSEPFISRIVVATNEFTSRIIITISVIVIAASLFFSIDNFGQFSRDEMMISDVQTIAKNIKPGATIGGHLETCYDWSLVAYLMRYGKISISCSDDYEYFLDKKGSNNKLIEHDVELNDYILRPHIKN